MKGNERNIKLLVEYDGTDWHGWQIQPNAPTIQGELEAAILRVTGEPRRVTGSSRTDAGVHAAGQVCNFYTTSRIPTERIPYALNANLPPSIVVLQAEEVAPEFHARYDAVGKRYIYEIINRPLPSALRRRYSYHVARPLDLAAMHRAAAMLQGEHDFAAFQAAGSSVQNTVRNLSHLSVREVQPGRLLICVEGNGFLYNMVRILVGTLVWVGSGRLGPEAMPQILRSRDRSQAGPTAPPQGLCLEKVFYDRTYLDTGKTLR
ncbi:MAG: tRNA pseudouridine(38-40) synthase TruA [Firmicutes bacterium]|nr:tRNA pseudouridine(38-40) synthase TruA [Bacillota bacterium]